MPSRPNTASALQGFVGRDGERNELTEIVDRALAGAMVGAVVTGPAGSGVSRLLAVAAAAAERRADVIRLGAGTRDVSVEALDQLVSDPERSRPLVLVLDDGYEYDSSWAQEFAAALCRWCDRPDQQRMSTAVLVGRHQTPARSVADDVIVDTLLREFDAPTVRLGSLTALEAFELAHGVLGGRPSSALTDEVVRLTDALPGPLTDLLHAARDAGALVAGADGWRRTVPLAALTANGPAPPDHRVAAAVLDRLSATARLLVEHAACVGPSTPVRLLERAVEGADAALDELVAAGLVDEDGDTLWFVEPAVQAGVVAAMPIRRRQQRAAALVAAWARAGDAGSLSAPAARTLFEQALLAGPKLDTGLLHRTASATAVAAVVAQDWATATRAHEAALGTGVDTGVDLVERLSAAGHAHHFHLANVLAVERYEQAAAQAEELGLLDKAAECRVLGMHVRVYAAMPAPDREPSPNDPPAVVAWSMLLRANQLFAAAQIGEGRRLCEEAVAIAREAELLDVEIRATLALGLQHLLELELDGARRGFEATARLAVRSEEPLARQWPSSRLALTEWLDGRTLDMVQRSRESADQADSASWWAEGALSWATVALGAFSSGDLAGTVRAAGRSRRLVVRSGYGFALPIAMPVWVAATAFSGDEHGTVEALGQWAQVGHVPQGVTLLTRAMFGAAPPRPVRRPSPHIDLARAGRIVLAAELADWTDDPDLAADMLAPLTTLVERRVYGVTGWPVSVPRAAALAAWHAGDTERASMLNGLARLNAEQGGDRIGEALAAFDAARWAPDGEDRTRRLAAAVGRLDRLGLATWAARAQRLLDACPFAGELAATHATRVLVYTDLVGSTSINVRLGDRRFLQLIAEHQALVDECAAAHRGTRFHNTGDGFGLWFADVDDALAYATTLHRRFAQATARHPEAPLEARIGVAAGQPVPFDGDLYGTAVVRAARVCAQATAGGVLVADEVLELNPHQRFHFSVAGLQLLKGFDDHTTLYRLTTHHTPGGANA